MISGLFGLIFAFAFVAAIALVCAVLLDKFARNRSVLGRAFAASFVAGFTPMIIAAFGVLGVADEINPVEALLPLAFGGLVLALFIGFPAAYVYTRRRKRARKAAVSPDVFE